MPILAPEPAVFPDGLLDDSPFPEGDGRAWWVLHTKPRQEKSLARDLLGRQVPFYLPLIDRPSTVRGRPVRVQLPLFPGYVFLRATEQERLAALTTQRVVRTLAVSDQPGLWRDLTQVRRLIATGEPITPEQRLLPGMMVEILGGPLAGMRGKVVRLDSGRRFVIAVDFMQQGASVLLDDSTPIRVESGATDRSPLPPR